MDPKRPKQDENDERADDVMPEAPELEEQDWDAIESGALPPDSLPENGDLRYEEDPADVVLEEDDDNPYENSDEALPDDEEEAALAENPSKEGGLFDEV